MNALTLLKKMLTLSLLTALTFVFVRAASATLPLGNTVQQWNNIAEDTVVGSGAFQPEGYVYMAYVSAAVYDGWSQSRADSSHTALRSRHRQERRPIAQ
jgi:hypothetical protein